LDTLFLERVHLQKMLLAVQLQILLLASSVPDDGISHANYQVCAVTDLSLM